MIGEFSAAQLRSQLPPFGEAPASPIAPLTSYLDFYGIGFSHGRAGVSHRLGTIQSGDFLLAAHHFQQSQAQTTLLVVHGYLDHSGLYRHLIEYGLNRGWNVLAFDLPGHGLSSGEPATIDDFASYAQAIRDVMTAALPAGAPVAVIGQSTGCTALLECAIAGYWPFRATVLLAPLVQPIGWVWMKRVYPLLRWFSSSVPRGFNSSNGDPAFSEFLKSDPLQSHRLPLAWLAALDQWLERLPQTSLGPDHVLIVQGDRDQTVRWRYNLKIMRHLIPDHELFILAGGGHRLANETPELRLQYLARVDQFLKTVPGSE